jgi:tetratricopeptide (TPR) repeat protein
MVFGGETADSYYDEGVTASMKGDVAAAVRHFEKALQLDPYHIASCHQLGKCKVRQGKLQEAVECFYRAIKARPGPLPPKLDFAFALLEGGNVPRAEDVFHEVLKMKPDQPRALLGLGCCAFEQGEWDRALNMATQAVTSGGATFPALYLQARAAQLVGLHDVAHTAFEEADALLGPSIDSSPEQPEAYFLRGELYFARKNFVAALEAFKVAQSHVDPAAHYYSYGEHFELADVLERQGMCLLRMDRKGEARELAADILALRPTSKVAAMLAGSGDPQALQ